MNKIINQSELLKNLFIHEKIIENLALLLLFALFNWDDLVFIKHLLVYYKKLRCML
jgi:hypothetical protein